MTAKISGASLRKTCIAALGLRGRVRVRIRVRVRVRVRVGIKVRVRKWYGYGREVRFYLRNATTAKA